MDQRDTNTAPPDTGSAQQPTQPKGIDPKTSKPYEPVEIPVPKISMFRAAIRAMAQPNQRTKHDE
jgi:hypothetical protein